MSDIPETFMDAARDALADTRARLPHDHEFIIARALMAAAKEADEAATKRERESANATDDAHLARHLRECAAEIAAMENEEAK